jgi:hypothetical protein
MKAIHIAKELDKYYYIDATQGDGFAHQSAPFEKLELLEYLKIRFGFTEEALAAAFEETDETGNAQLDLP